MSDEGTVEGKAYELAQRVEHLERELAKGRRRGFVCGAIAALAMARDRVGDAAAGERAMGVIEGVTLREVCTRGGEDVSVQDLDPVEMERARAHAANEDRNRVWGELAALAMRLGFDRARSPDFGEGDLVALREHVEIVATAADMLATVNDAALSAIEERDQIAARLEEQGRAVLDAGDAMIRARTEEYGSCVRVPRETLRRIMTIAMAAGRWVEAIDNVARLGAEMPARGGSSIVPTPSSTREARTWLDAHGALAEARDVLVAAARAVAAHGDSLPDAGPGLPDAPTAPAPDLTPAIEYQVVDALDRADGRIEFDGYQIAGRIGRALIVCASDARDAERIVEALREHAAALGGYDSVIVVPEAVRFLRVRDEATRALVEAAHRVLSDPSVGEAEEALMAALRPFEVR